MKCPVKKLFWLRTIIIIAGFDPNTKNRKLFFLNRSDTMKLIYCNWFFLIFVITSALVTSQLRKIRKNSFSSLFGTFRINHHYAKNSYNMNSLHKQSSNDFEQLKSVQSKLIASKHQPAEQLNKSLHTKWKAKTGQDRRSQNVSNLLDQLLLGYDSHIRPNFGGPPIEVLIDFHIRSMGPISEIDMTYVMDCYFRQTWTDHRLAFKSRTSSSNVVTNAANDTVSNPNALALSVYMLDRIWKPPSYILNSRKSHIHSITTPNKFVRIDSNGRVLYSSRMTIQANCPMNLENFPMDTQRCPLALGSFGYTSKDLIYNWNPNRKVVINPSMKMSQFDLIAVPVHAYNSSMQTASMRHTYSVLVATFHFKRHMGSFVIEVYAPCIMLVVLSWVGFWINREATADRVTLGLTTVLTMTFLGLELRNDLPKVPYLTSLDFFVYISFAFISATILEFGFVHFFTKIGSGEYYFTPIHEAFVDQNNYNKDEDEDEYEDEEDANGKAETDTRPKKKNLILMQKANYISRSTDSVNHPLTNAHIIRSSSWTMTSGGALRHSQTKNLHRFQNVAIGGESLSNEYDHQSESNLSRISSLRNSFRNRLRHSNIRASNAQRRPSLLLRGIEHRNAKSNNVRRNASNETSIRVQLNSVSQIDRISRVIFPVTFLAMNFVYWYIYLRAELNIDKHQWHQQAADGLI